jgi:anhydro-N-acetylmuramic acid kinase
MLVAGLMSGTSVDGIDVALVEIEGEGFNQRIRPVAFHEIPYPPGVRHGVFAISNAEISTARLSQMNFLLGELFGDAVVEACKRSSIPLSKLDLVGSHGQTIYHQSSATTLYDRAVASTLQIGEPSLIAARTATPVVADFRPADMAVGGQGAPLVPYVDYLLYRHPEKGRVALNIGGIANLTAIPPGAPPEAVVAFDTGPGNMVIDALVSQFSVGALTFDRDGRMAASGRVHHPLLAELMKAPYIKRSPPKSCGREQYGAAFISGLLAEGLPAADLVATATAFTVAAVAEAVRNFVAPRMPVDELIVSGGGAKNPEILRRLRDQLGRTRILNSSELGIDGDAKEAIAFAALAYESWHRRPANLPSATGARRSAILGKLCYPPAER